VLHEAIDALGAHAHDDRQRALIELVRAVTTAPWSLSRADHARWNAAGLTDDDLLHAIALASYFGHLNRIADAVAVPLDYTVAISAPRVDPSVPPFAAAPMSFGGSRALELERRPATMEALAAWRGYLADKTGPLAPPARSRIAAWVATWLGDGGVGPAAVHDDELELHALAEIVTLAPWRLDDAAFAALRAHGFTDAALFDVCATASSAGTFSRIDVALRALAR
jgi:alkylhydroperoxidase family enzyme